MIDILIVGMGGAGLSVALSAKSRGANTLLVGKSYVSTSQTAMAQGGINAPLGNITKDSIESHISDTVKSAHGLCDIDMVTKMCSDAPKTIEWLDTLGVPFDRTEDNKIAQRELGGASSKRACYAQDYTGLKILHTLYDNVLKEDIGVREELFLLNLIVDNGVTKGCTFWDIKKGEVVEIIAKRVVIATGGYAGIYKNYTTNANGSTGDGIASVLRAGGRVSDMEFVQFHPTALKHSSILISESARGEGGYLVNSDGKRFVDELLPRDVVARAIASEIRDGKDVFLDVRHLGEEKLLKLMPQEVHLARLHEGVDPVKELIPIKPVAHYTMGGIDVNSSFEVNGLKNCYAVGECSNSKVHGANRLGGNSLLEIISLGRLLGEIVSEDLPQDEEIISSNQLQKDREFIDSLFEEYPFEQNFYQLENNLGEKFYKYAGIVRNNNQLNNLLNKIRVIKADIDNMGIKDKNRTDNSNLVDFLQFLNILDVGEIVVESAIIRDESRGAHYKEAYSNEEPSYLAHSIFWIEDGAIQNRFQKVAKQ